MTIKVTCEVEVYEYHSDSEQDEHKQMPSVFIRNDHIDSGKVWIDVEGKHYQVVSRDLERAIGSATNAHNGILG